jgi:hypothetical protein
MNFFNIDCHVSVISDIKNIFTKLGHAVDNWSISGHRWVFDFDPCQSPIINADNWKSIDEKMVDDFYKTHKEELDKYDAFICCYPPIFLKLFEKFNKPIIVVAATRYDFPVIDDSIRLAWLEDSLNNNNNLILIANNEFDKKYCELFLKKEWKHIPSLCDYTNAKYQNLKKESIIFSKLSVDTEHIHVSSLGKYSWEDLFSHKSIIHLPYNVSTMSIFEQYQAGVPLHFPSIDLALSLIKSGIPLFSEIVFSNNHPERQAGNFLNKEWLSYSDFYNGTIECSYFNSLQEKLEEVKPKRNNTEKVFNLWTNLLSSIT